MTPTPLTPPDIASTYTAEYLHRLLDEVSAVQADGAGLLSDPPHLMTVTQRIKRLGEDNAAHIADARLWHKRWAKATDWEPQNTEAK